MRMVVITGGPCSGKTTVIEEIARRGHRTVPEAAIDVITGLNAERGVEGQKRWRSAHLDEFQQMVFDLQREREDALAPGDDPVFLDRGLADGIAYFHLARLDPPSYIVDISSARPYEHAFVLETLPEFDARRSTGRSSTFHVSRRLHHLLHDAYEEIGVPVTRIPVMPVGLRVDRILEEIAI